MSTLLGIDDNNYAPQPMKGGGSTEDLTEVLNAQDTLLENQETKIGQMVQALANKKSIDLATETADATAVAGDIASGKTAYVNGEKITGNMTPATTPVITSGLRMAGSTSTNFDWLADVDTSQLTTGKYFLNNCTNVTQLPLFDTSHMEDVSYMFSNCTSLVTIPVYDFTMASNIEGMFSSDTSLSDTSLENILKSAITMTHLYSGMKRLGYSGFKLNQEQIDKCKAMPEWETLQSMGWQ